MEVMSDTLDCAALDPGEGGGLRATIGRRGEAGGRVPPSGEGNVVFPLDERMVSPKRLREEKDGSVFSFPTPICVNIPFNCAS